MFCLPPLSFFVTPRLEISKHPYCTLIFVMANVFFDILEIVTSDIFNLTFYISQTIYLSIARKPISSKLLLKF